jgi:hypothetical protein
MGAGISPAFFVFVLGKTPFQIVGDAGVDAVIGALEKIDKIHKWDEALRFPSVAC